MTGFGAQVQLPGPIQNAKINFAASGDTPIIAAIANKRIFIYRLYFILGAATDITFKDGSTALTGAMPFLANGFMILDPTQVPWHQTSIGAAFNINSSNAVQVSGSIGFIQA